MVTIVMTVTIVTIVMIVMTVMIKMMVIIRWVMVRRAEIGIGGDNDPRPGRLGEKGRRRGRAVGREASGQLLGRDQHAVAHAAFL